MEFGDGAGVLEQCSCDVVIERCKSCVALVTALACCGVQLRRGGRRGAAVLHREGQTKPLLQRHAPRGAGPSHWHVTGAVPWAREHASTQSRACAGLLNSLACSTLCGTYSPHGTWHLYPTRSFQGCFVHVAGRG